MTQIDHDRKNQIKFKGILSVQEEWQAGSAFTLQNVVRQFPILTYQ